MASGCSRRRGVRRHRRGNGTMNWREVEQALIAMARSWGWYVDQNSNTGNVMMDKEGVFLDLTEIAKELVDRLGRKG